MSDLHSFESIQPTEYETLEKKVTATKIGSKYYLDVLASFVMSADEDTVETRSMAMKIALDEVSSTVTYVGEAITGTALSAASWRIKRISVTGTVTLIEWADGNGSFDNIWNNRASLSYS
jgi:hypothetical protein